MYNADAADVLVIGRGGSNTVVAVGSIVTAVELRKAGTSWGKKARQPSKEAAATNATTAKAEENVVRMMKNWVGPSRLGNTMVSSVLCDVKRNVTDPTLGPTVCEIAVFEGLQSSRVEGKASKQGERTLADAEKRCCERMMSRQSCEYDESLLVGCRLCDVFLDEVVCSKVRFRI